MRSLMRVGMVGICTFALFLFAPTFAQAADEPSVEAAEVVPAETPALSVEHLRAEISAEADPELRAAMEEQLNLLESGQLDLQTLEQEMAVGPTTGTGQGEAGGTGTRLTEGVGFVGPPVDVGMGGGTTGGNDLPPEARAELEKIFSQGTGDPSKDGALREQAEKVFERYGIERDQFGGGMGSGGDYEGRGGGMESGGSMREAFERGGGLEQRGEGFERAMTERMAPEAREQMERFMSEREMSGSETSRESMEREMGGMEREMMEREFGGTSSERSYEAPTHDYEAPTHEYEAPATESPMRESDPLEGSGTGPH